MKHPLEAFTAAITFLAPKASPQKIEKIWTQLTTDEAYQLSLIELEHVVHFLLKSAREKNVSIVVQHYMVVALTIFFRKSSDWRTKIPAQQYVREVLPDLGVPEADSDHIVELIQRASIQSRTSASQTISEAQKVFCDCTLLWLTAPHFKKSGLDPVLTEWLRSTKKPFLQTEFDNQFGQLTPS